MDLELDPVEARALGCLVEKEATTPDVYPLTTNALVSACNQKTARDPVMDVSARQVDAALLSLRQKSLVRAVHIQGSRSTKHRHVIPEALALTEAQIAVLAVLLLRGAQTVGELRGRTERIHAFDELSEVESVLNDLAAHEPALVQQLGRAPGQKEARWIQLLSDTGATDPSLIADAAPAAPSTGQSVIGQTGGAGRAPSNEVTELRAEVGRVTRRLDALVAWLGDTLGEAPDIEEGSPHGDADSTEADALEAEA